MAKLTRYIVSKPWGEEYLIYKNKNLAAWLLKLNPSMKTSFHCHPKKKTGFILLSGKVEIKLGFYEKKTLTKVSKVMIRPGLFHETKAISKKDAYIIELEVPNIKEDIVRYKDIYGRENKEIEGKKFYKPLPKKSFLLKEKKFKLSKFKFENLNFELKRYKKLDSKNFKNKNNIHAILDGGLGRKKNNLVLCPGDIVRSDTILKLSQAFQPLSDILILTILNER